MDLVNKHIDFFINIGTYKTKFVIGRILVVSAIAIILVNIAKVVSGATPFEDQRKIFPYLIVVAAFNSASEINLLLMRWFSRLERLRWKIYPQVLAIIFVAFLLTYFWLSIAKLIFADDEILNHAATKITIILGISFLVIHILIVIISNLTNEWMNNRRVIEELKQAKLLSDYNSLKDRLNPHFLFNNLSVLKSLIHYSPKDAEVFTQNFTDVYRYVLTSHEKPTVSLEKELTFLRSYIALHKERIGEGLEVNIDIDNELLLREIPPMALQLLVENAIKHNITSKKEPLKIEIYSKRKTITVKNSLNKKETTYSTHMGMDTLRAQYKLVSNKGITVMSDDNYYYVTVPLL